MTTRLTDEQIAELERLERAATPGTWSDVNEYGVESVVSDEGLSVTTADLRDESPDEHTRACTDMTLIAAARNALPSLLSEVRARRASPDEETLARTIEAVLPPPCEFDGYCTDAACRLGMDVRDALSSHRSGRSETGGTEP